MHFWMYWTSFVFLMVVVLADMERIVERLGQLERESGNSERIFTGNVAQIVYNDLLDLGCWCRFKDWDDMGTMGKGPPTQTVDLFCRTLTYGYMCIVIDAVDEDYLPCKPWEIPYNTTGGNTEMCYTANPGNMCAARACIVEARFTDDLFAFMLNGNQIDDDGPAASCTRHINTAEPVEHKESSEYSLECCGDYEMDGQDNITLTYTNEHNITHTYWTFQSRIRTPYRAPIVNGTVEKACCGSMPYNNNKYNACCDQTPYNINNSGCCNTTVYKTNDGDKACCGSTVYKTHGLNCCRSNQLVAHHACAGEDL